MQSCLDLSTQGGPPAPVRRALWPRSRLLPALPAPLWSPLTGWGSAGASRVPGWATGLPPPPPHFCSQDISDAAGPVRAWSPLSSPPWRRGSDTDTGFWHAGGERPQAHPAQYLLPTLVEGSGRLLLEGVFRRDSLRALVRSGGRAASPWRAMSSPGGGPCSRDGGPSSPGGPPPLSRPRSTL